MPEGSLTTSLQSLQSALNAVDALLGEPPTNGAGGSGFAGAAGLAAQSPVARISDFSSQFSARTAGVLSFDAHASFGGVAEMFAAARGPLQSAPTQVLDGFAQRVAEARGAFSGDLIGKLEQARDAVRSIADGVPTDPNAVVGALLDQILAVLASLDGPEAARIRAWIQSVQDLQRILLPVIEQAQAGGDPAAAVLAVMQRSVDNTLDILGFGPVRKLIDLLDSFPADRLPADLLTSVGAQLDLAMDAYTQALGLAGGGYAAFRDSVASSAAALQELELRLRPVNSALRQVTSSAIFQPNALENFLREHIDQALGVQVVEVQKIDDPIKALFDRIDAAIGEIDLTAVRTETLAFFERVRTTIESVDVPALGTTLQAQLAPVQQLFAELQAGVTGLLAQLRAFFDGLAGQLRSLAGNVGDYAADGSFHYNFERDLRALLGSAQRAIGGDPANPAAPSLAGTLNEFRGSIDQFLAQLNGLLQPLGQTIEDAKNTAVDGIDNFVTFLNGLNIADLIETLRQQVEGIVQALTPIDFDVVVDPVVAGIDENTAKLQDIDPSALNDLLREALAAALEVVMSIDFTVEISAPLNEQLDQIKALPTQAIEQLQQRYEQALSFLDQLSPQQLLEALFAAFDTINQAVGQLNVAQLLQPLDQLHQQQLVQPLAQLKPSTLIAPLTSAFGDLSRAVGGVKGQALLAPLTNQLDQLKAIIANFNITGWVDELLAAVESTKQRLRAMRPSLALQALTADFARLESALDQFKPSVIFQPAAALAAPLLQFLESIQQQTIDALFAIFQAPLQLFERLQPAALTQRLVQQIDTMLQSLRALNLPARFNQLKGRHYDLTLAVAGEGIEAKVALAAAIDPEPALGALVTVYTQLLAGLEALKQNVQLAGLSEVYATLRERLIGLLPPFARELLDVETFKRLMRLADPTRFLQELDLRFSALKDRLIPIRPQDIAAELDAAYDALLQLVEGLDIAGALNQVKATLEGIKDIAATVRVDFLAGDIDRAVADLRALVDGLNPASLAGELDALHAAVVQVVADTKPSTLLGGLQQTLDQVKAVVASVDPRATLGPPLEEAWDSVEGLLEAIDFTIILSPLSARIDELAAAFLAALRRVEQAFDQMLGAARTALSGSGASASVGVGI